MTVAVAATGPHQNKDKERSAALRLGSRGRMCKWYDDGAVSARSAEQSDIINN